nr:dihydrolipoamide acetyltransferase family protein [uncultured Desulfobulbus sp.]
MPSLGADMESGTLVEWLVEPGAWINKGDIIATIETQKGLFEIEAFEEGYLGEPVVQPGTEVPVGTVLAVISSVEPSEMSETKAAAAKAEAEIPPSPPPPTEIEVSEAPVAATSGRITVSPAARRLAAQLGVDLSTISASGADGVIHRQDVERASQQPAEAARATSPVQPPPSADINMRRAIAAAMSRSNREIPHYYLESDIDMSVPLQWLEAENGKKSIRERILPVALLLKAVALGLRDVPELNGYWLDDQLQIKSSIHIGFALGLRKGGLVTPAIHDVDTLPLSQLMEAMTDLIERSRSGRLRGSEMTDATVSVTNLGDRGVKSAFGIIYPPQVALIAFGRIMERPWAEEGHLVLRRCMTVTLAGDHRATDGHTGALYLEALNRHLQQPEAL